MSLELQGQTWTGEENAEATGTQVCKVMRRRERTRRSQDRGREGAKTEKENSDVQGLGTGRGTSPADRVGSHREGGGYQRGSLSWKQDCVLSSG